jgi:hypothetical protein
VKIRFILLQKKQQQQNNDSFLCSTVMISTQKYIRASARADGAQGQGSKAVV